MSTDRIAPETIAALLDGRLQSVERERVLAAIAQSPELCELLADAAALRGESVLDTPSLRRRPRRRWLVALPVVAAASIATLLLLPRVSRAPTHPSRLADAVLESSSNLDDLRRRMRSEWIDPPWAVTRGDETVHSDQGRAFRAGVRAFDLEAAARLGDSAAVSRLAAELSRGVASVRGGPPAAALLNGLQRGSAFDTRARDAAINSVRELYTDRNAFDLGAWVSAARLALAAGNFAFLAESGPGGRTIVSIANSIGSRTAENDALVGVVERLVRATHERPGAERNLVISRLLDSALVATGR